MIKRAYEDFSDDQTFDFTMQLNRLSWFCIMLSLNERHNLGNRKERQAYCKKIMSDEMIKECSFYPKWYDVSLRQKILMYAIKKNLWWLIAEV